VYNKSKYVAPSKRVGGSSSWISSASDGYRNTGGSSASDGYRNTGGSVADRWKPPKKKTEPKQKPSWASKPTGGGGSGDAGSASWIKKKKKVEPKRGWEDDGARAGWGGELKLEDSNMANVGTKEDRDRRMAVAMAEPEWQKAGPPTKPGAVIWRVENEKARGGKAASFGVKSWPSGQYGSLYLGDSYVIFNATKGSDVEPDPRYEKTFFWKNASFKSGDFKMDIYYWLGSASSIDEKGTAAIKTIELDSYLGASSSLSSDIFSRL